MTGTAPNQTGQKRKRSADSKSEEEDQGDDGENAPGHLSVAEAIDNPIYYLDVTDAGEHEGERDGEGVDEVPAEKEDEKVEEVDAEGEQKGRHEIACIFCPGKIMKNRFMVKVHLESKVSFLRRRCRGFLFFSYF